MPCALGVLILIKAQSAACAAKFLDWSILNGFQLKHVLEDCTLSARTKNNQGEQNAEGEGRRKAKGPPGDA
jgi:hypothetical protein